MGEESSKDELSDKHNNAAGEENRVPISQQMSIRKDHRADMAFPKIEVELATPSSSAKLLEGDRPKIGGKTLNVFQKKAT